MVAKKLLNKMLAGKKRPVKKTAPGAAAEQQACKLLRQQGLKIRTRNYRTKRGEIDIIAEDGDTLVFVEVRLRSNSRYGSPEESITPRKQQRIIYASQHYLQKEQISDAQPCRFDTICLTDDSGSTASDTQWLKNAFDGGTHGGFHGKNGW